MRFLVELDAADTLKDLVAAACATHRAGLDGILISANRTTDAPLVAAAAIARRVDDLLIGAEVELGNRHPIEVAEEAAVVDLASGGRLILVTYPATGEEPVFGEALDLLRTAWRPRPFRFDGTRWRVPASLPEHTHNTEQRTRVTPSPLQPRLELWGSRNGADVAAGRGLGAVWTERASHLEALWERIESELGAVGIGAARARREQWTDAPAVVERLREGRRTFGQDWVVIKAPIHAVETIGRYVRPRVQLDALPPGLEQHWDTTLPTGRENGVR